MRRQSKIYFRQFHYPVEGGYGAICQGLYRKIEDRVSLDCRVTGLQTEGRSVRAVRFENDGEEQAYPCEHVISTLPATVLGRMLGHSFALRFKGITLIYPLVDKPRVMPYHWVYFGDRDVVINRLAEFKNFSDVGVPEDKMVLAAEVTMPSERPLEDVLSALERYRLVHRDDVLDTLELHEAFGYPVYDFDYEKARLEAAEVFGHYCNLHLVGRKAECRHIEVDEDFASAAKLVRELFEDRVTPAVSRNSRGRRARGAGSLYPAPATRPDDV